MNISPSDLDPQAAIIYKTALETIIKADIPFLVGGGIAFKYHTGYPRSFNDLDLFCKAGDYPKILKLLEEQGFTAIVQDEKWLAKATKDGAQIDILFSAPNNVQIVDDDWFENGKQGELFDMKVAFVGAEELFWSKIYVQNADKFDGPDVYHLILKVGSTLDWRKTLSRMETDWEVLFAALINYRFIFPSKRDIVPEWLMRELIERLERQLELPTPHDDTSRGPLLSRTNYAYDIQEGGFIA